VEYEAVVHDAPRDILKRLAELEAEISEGQRELEGMLG
jgi:type I restriction enzyme M protein